MKKYYILLGIVGALGVLALALSPHEVAAPERQPAAESPRAGELGQYQIDGALQGARYFGNEARGDLTGDGIDDSIFLIVQEPGGSGSFYYAVARISTATSSYLTNAFFIGDRIAPQTSSIIAGEAHINYAERAPGEPMSAPPTYGATTLLKVTKEGVLEGLMK